MLVLKKKKRSDSKKPQTNCKLDLDVVYFFVIIWHSTCPWFSWFTSPLNSLVWKLMRCLARLCEVHWAGTREYQLLSKAFFSLFLTRHWESWGSPRWTIKRLTRRNWRYQWIHSVFSLYPHCFATFLYSHVFLYINILKIFCRSLFIKVIFSRPQLFLKWHGGHGSFLRFTPKGLVLINFQLQLFVLVKKKKKKTHCPTWCVACFYPLFFQRNLVHLKYTNLKPQIYFPVMVLMIPEACKTL